MSKKKVQVTINNAVYFFVTDESEEHLQQAAERVDESVRTILQAGAEAPKAAVLAALQLASSLVKLEKIQQDQEEEKRRLVERIERESQLFASLS